MKTHGMALLLAILLGATGCRTCVHSKVWEYKSEVIYVTLGNRKMLDKSLNDLCHDGWTLVSLSALEPIQGVPNDSPKAIVVLKRAKQ
jgi:hypothetical protein